MKKEYQYRAIIYLTKDKAYGKLDDFYTLKGALMVAEGYSLDRGGVHTQVIGKEGVIQNFPIEEKPKTRKKTTC
jgi:hypothetical protein